MSALKATGESQSPGIEESSLIEACRGSASSPGVEGIKSEATLCCVEVTRIEPWRRAWRVASSSTCIEPGVEPYKPGVEPYRAIHVLHTASAAPSSRVSTMLQTYRGAAPPFLVNKV